MITQNFKKRETNILIWIIASIIFHILLLIVTKLYKMQSDETPNIPRIDHNDTVTLWQHQPTKPMPPTTQPNIKKPSTKPEEQPQQSATAKPRPIIIPGKQGDDIQNLDGIEKQAEPNLSENSEQSQQETATETEVEIESEQNTQQEAAIEQEPHDLAVKNNVSCDIQYKEPFKLQTKPHIPFAKSTKYSLIKKSTPQKIINKNSMGSIPLMNHQPKNNNSFSFKNLNLGSNNVAKNLGNSAHLQINGSSRDIPEGEELRYITYLNQMANAICNSISTHPLLQQTRYLPHTRKPKDLAFFMSVTRDGKLLDVHMVQSSEHSILNQILIESVKNVGLFNSLPKFINKDVFSITWTVLT